MTHNATPMTGTPHACLARTIQAARESMFQFLSGEGMIFCMILISGTWVCDSSFLCIQASPPTIPSLGFAIKTTLTCYLLFSGTAGIVFS